MRPPPISLARRFYLAASGASVRTRRRGIFGSISIPARLSGGRLRLRRAIAELRSACDKLARSEIENKNHLHRGISYTRMFQTLVPRTKSASGGWHVQSARDSERDEAGDRQRACSLGIFCASSNLQLAKRSGGRTGWPPRTIPACNRRNGATIAAMPP